MGLSIGIKNNKLLALSKKISNIGKEMDSGQFLEDTAKLLNASIQIRVQSKGKGILGEKLKAYSSKYSTFKQNKGRNTNYRDLTFSGKMWQSLTTNRSNNQAKMFFGNVESINKASGNQKRTPFFGLADSEKAILKKELNKFIKI